MTTKLFIAAMALSLLAGVAFGEWHGGRQARNMGLFVSRWNFHREGNEELPCITFPDESMRTVEVNWPDNHFGRITLVNSCGEIIESAYFRIDDPKSIVRVEGAPIMRK